MTILGFPVRHRFSRSGEGFWAAEPRSRSLLRLNRTAALSGAVAMLGCTAIGFVAYSASYEVALEGLNAIPAPLAEIETNFRSRILPHVAGLALITLGLLPLLLLLLYRSFLSSQKKLRESEQRMRLALEGTIDGIWDWDVVSGKVSYDDGWQRILGYEPAEQKLDFAWWEPSVHPESKPVFQQALAGCLEGREKYFEVEYRIRTKSGESKWIRTRGTCVVRGKEGQPLRMIGTHRDITREKALEEQLRQAQKMEAVGQLAGGVAHDFNNLLQIILIHTEIGMEQTAASSRLGESLVAIDQAAERAAELTRRLLVFSRELHPVDLDLHQVVAEVVKMLRCLIGVDVEIHVLDRHPLDGPGGAYVHADRGQLGEVIMNLCINARDAMIGGGTITLELYTDRFDEASCRQRPWARPGEFVVLRVSDTGCGIPEEVLGKIFEPFFTTKEIGQGTGLGLSMVTAIVEQHQGWIHVDSEPGRGTTFRLGFPRIEPGGVERAERVPSRPRGGTETILFVEDEEGIRTVAAHILEQAGYKILVARHGAEAVELFRESAEDVSLVVLDLMMPVMGGAEAREEIRKIDREVRFLFSTGFGKTVFPNAELRNTPVLAKPYSRSVLLLKVREVLDE